MEAPLNQTHPGAQPDGVISTSEGVASEALISRAQLDALYELLGHVVGVGPFDGGCLAVAKALQRIHGGEIVVLAWRPRSSAGRSAAAHVTIGQHAVVRLSNGLLADADGPASAEGMIRRCSEGFMIEAREISIRPLVPGDLQDAPCDPALVSAIVHLLRPRSTFGRLERRPSLSEPGFAIP